MATGLTGKPVSLSRKRARGIKIRYARFTLIWLLRAWKTLRELSGDDAYERYFAHHIACHADTAPLSRKEFFQRDQQQKWNSIKRCC
jgi:uncharacterized short protein YbdD (DUF466 family)